MANLVLTDGTKSHKCNERFWTVGIFREFIRIKNHSSMNDHSKGSAWEDAC